jgi:hypothetical protein
MKICASALYCLGARATKRPTADAAAIAAPMIALLRAATDSRKRPNLLGRSMFGSSKSSQCTGPSGNRNAPV